MNDQGKTNEELTVELHELQQKNNFVKSVYIKDTLNLKILRESDSKGEMGENNLILYFSIPYNTELEERKSMNYTGFN